ncbi:MAG: hypothetical protein AAGU75_01995 [Bacillota bacterium]
MKYRFYLRLKVQENNWVKVGSDHDINWDNRDLVKASSGWLIVNQEKVGTASDIVPKLHKGILELKNASENYSEYELNHGLGTIKNVLTFYEKLLQDCQQYPFTELCGCVAS